MVKTILVPIDFEAESLNTLKLALKQHAGQQVMVYLVYGELLDESITRLLFYNPEKRINTLGKPAFAKQLADIRTLYADVIADIQIELFHGYTHTAFRLFAKDRNVAEIYLPENYVLKQTDTSLDLVAMAQRARIPLKWVGWSAAPAFSYGDEQPAMALS
jgi:hypothetical protein